MKISTPFLIVALACSPLLLLAQKYSNEFLSIGVGARAQGMGNAVVANVQDVTAGIWNPAGLVARDDFRGVEIGAMHNEWFGGVGKFDYLGVTLPLSDGGRRLGLSLIRFGIDNIPNTLSLYESDGTVNFDNLREFSAADYAFLISYAQPLQTKSGRLLVGGNVKVIHRRIGPFANSWGFGLDAALQYRTGAWHFGVLAKDITTTFNAWSFDFSAEDQEVLELTNNEVPINSVETTNPRVILGAGRRFEIDNFGIAPELNLIVTTDGERNTLLASDPFSINPAFGVEADYEQFLFLRAGLNQFQYLTDFDNSESLYMRPSFGVGFRIASFQVDYAFSSQGGIDENYSHVVSLLLSLKSDN